MVVRAPPFCRDSPKQTIQWKMKTRRRRKYQTLGHDLRHLLSKQSIKRQPNSPHSHKEPRIQPDLVKFGDPFPSHEKERPKYTRNYRKLKDAFRQIRLPSSDK